MSSSLFIVSPNAALNSSNSSSLSSGYNPLVESFLFPASPASNVTAVRCQEGVEAPEFIVPFFIHAINQKTQKQNTGNSPEPSILLLSLRNSLDFYVSIARKLAVPLDSGKLIVLAPIDLCGNEEKISSEPPSLSDLRVSISSYFTGPPFPVLLLSFLRRHPGISTIIIEDLEVYCQETPKPSEKDQNTAVIDSFLELFSYVEENDLNLMIFGQDGQPAHQQLIKFIQPAVDLHLSLAPVKQRLFSPTTVQGRLEIIQTPLYFNGGVGMEISSRQFLYTLTENSIVFESFHK